MSTPPLPAVAPSHPSSVSVPKPSPAILSPAPSAPLAAAVIADAPRPFPCPHPGCDKAYFKLGKLNRHVSTHSAVPTHSCPHLGCPRAFHRSDHLHRHLLSHANVRAFHCTHPSCTASFLTATHLTRHQRSHTHPSHPCTFPSCALAFTKRCALRQHLHTAHGFTTTLACPHPPCTLTFPSRSLLTKHVHLAHTPARHHCHLCPLSFPRHADYRRHQLSHEADDWRCEQCGKTVRRKRKREHERSHTQEEGGVACEREGCGWRGRTRGGLRVHERVKHGEEEEGGGRRWECEECGKRFGYKVVMERHVRRVHRRVGEEGEEGEERKAKKRRKTEKEKAFGGAAMERYSADAMDGGEEEEDEQQEEVEQETRRFDQVEGFPTVVTVM